MLSSLVSSLGVLSDLFMAYQNFERSMKKLGIKKLIWENPLRNFQSEKLSSKEFFENNANIRI